MAEGVVLSGVGIRKITCVVALGAFLAMWLFGMKDPPPAGDRRTEDLVVPQQPSRRGQDDSGTLATSSPTRDHVEFKSSQPVNTKNSLLGGSLDEWRGAIEGLNQTQALHASVGYLEGVARDQQLSLQVGTELFGLLERNPELYTLAATALRRTEAANAQVGLLHALRGGVASGFVPYLAGDYLEVADNTADSELWQYVVGNSGGVGDSAITRVILEGALWSDSEDEVVFGVASLKRALEAERVALGAVTATWGTQEDPSEWLLWKAELVQLAQERAREGLPKQALVILENWFGSDPEASEALEAIRELLGRS